jgi:large subunit ribosomal protein L35
MLIVVQNIKTAAPPLFLLGVNIMPKMKTNKGIKKRFKISKGGKVQFRSAGKSHLLTSKSRKRKRKLRTDKVLGGSMAKNIKKLTH